MGFSVDAVLKGLSHSMEELLGPRIELVRVLFEFWGSKYQTQKGSRWMPHPERVLRDEQGLGYMEITFKSIYNLRPKVGCESNNKHNRAVIDGLTNIVRCPPFSPRLFQKVCISILRA